MCDRMHNHQSLNEVFVAQNWHLIATSTNSRPTELHVSTVICRSADMACGVDFIEIRHPEEWSFRVVPQPGEDASHGAGMYCMQDAAGIDDAIIGVHKRYVDHK